MEHNKAAGSNGFPAEFYQSFWEIIKGGLLLFTGLHAEQPASTSGSLSYY
jgi:hypothetical protein